MDGLLICAIVLGLLLIWREVRRLSAHVEATHEQLLQARRDLGQLPPLSDEPSEEVRALAAEASRRIEAIKLYREQSGADLKVANAVVERLRAPRGDAWPVARERTMRGRPPGPGAAPRVRCFSRPMQPVVAIRSTLS